MTAPPLRPLDPAYRTILVPLDGSLFAEGALQTARQLAARFGATMHTVSVVVSGFESRERARAESAQALGTDPDDPRVQVEVDTDVARAVQRRARELDAWLICLATHGRGRGGTPIGSTAREIIERTGEPVVVTGPLVRHPDAADQTAVPPLGVDRFVVCVDGSPRSEQGIPVAAAWAHALGMKLSIVTVAEPCPPPERIGAPWRRRHGPNEDAEEYLRRLGEQWALDAPGLDTFVVYDQIGPGPGLRNHLRAHPTGLLAVTIQLGAPLPHLVFGHGAADIVHAASAPVLVIPGTTKDR